MDNRRKTALLVGVVIVLVIVAGFIGFQLFNTTDNQFTAGNLPSKKVLDFEGEIPGLEGNGEDGQPKKREDKGIDTHFRNVAGTSGIVFANGANCPKPRPRLVKAGSPKIAFVGPTAVNGTMDDQPDPSVKAQLGDWMLTDDGSLPDNEDSCKMRITFDTPVYTFAVDVIDVDNGESMKLRFKDVNGNDIVAPITRKAAIGKPGTPGRKYDGKPWRDDNGTNPFSLKLTEPKIKEVVFVPAGGTDSDGNTVGGGYGLAYDNIIINDIPQQALCYRCTAATNDANTCESISIESGARCPSGYTPNPSCFAAAEGGVCPTDAPKCGDGEVNQDAEQCDDGNNTNGDGCSATCTTETTAPICGDGEVNQPSEQCDDGNNVDNDSCSNTCQLPPNVAQCGETCGGTSGNTCAAGSACTNGKCVLNVCAADPSKCEADLCTLDDAPVCGDGAVNQASEQCDDGNTANGDGCSSTCQVETTDPVCGDGTVNQSSEQCDDGNTANGDGCSSTCQVESGTSVGQCGDSCGGNTNVICPTDHTCTSGKCVLNTCVGDPSKCEADKCTVRSLPQTDLPGTPVMYILAVGMFLLSLVAYRTRFAERELAGAFTGLVNNFIPGARKSNFERGVLND